MGKRVAIVQSSYIPWKGYFDLIRAADEFVLLDEVQFTRRDWRSRNRIKTPTGAAWLSIPVANKGRFHQRIDQTLVSDPDWAISHWRTLRANYARTPHFREFGAAFEALYVRPPSLRLSDINRSFIDAVCSMLGIRTRISWSTDYAPREGRTERLLDVCLQTGATEYLSGPAARDYLDVSRFSEAGIAVTFVDYSGYAEYPQPYPPFDHHVSILDLFFCTGRDALQYMKAF